MSHIVKVSTFLFTNDKSSTQTSLAEREVVSIVYIVALAREWLNPQSVETRA